MNEKYEEKNFFYPFLLDNFKTSLRESGLFKLHKRHVHFVSAAKNYHTSECLKLRNFQT
jgi:hypothetical protein